jgi:hypothetical protein
MRSEEFRLRPWRPWRSRRRGRLRGGVVPSGQMRGSAEPSVAQKAVLALKPYVSSIPDATPKKMPSPKEAEPSPSEIPGDTPDALPSPSWFDRQMIPGVKNLYLALGGVALILLVVLKKKKTP